MSCHTGPDIATDSLLLHLDAGNVKSYPGTGTNWYDVSGNNRNATLFQSVAFSSAYKGVFDFTRPVGAQGYATVPHDSTISSQVFGTSNTFTLSAWVYPRSFNNYGTLIQKSQAGSYSNSTAGIWVDTAGLKMVIGSNVGNNPTGWGSYITKAATANSWYHIVAVGDGTQATMYVNGVYVGAILFSSITQTRTENASPITIGSRSTINAPELDALVGPISVWGRTLAVDEVLQLFNSQRSRFGV